MGPRTPHHRRPRTLLALAALVATSGCATLVDFDGDPYTVRDAGTNGGHHGDAAAGDDDDDGGEGRDAAVVDSGPPLDPCTAKGWRLDCDFGDGGILVLPVARDAGPDAGPEAYVSRLFVTMGADGTAYAVVSLGNGEETNADNDVAMYTVNDAGLAATDVIPTLGILADARTFGDSPMFLLAGDIDTTTGMTMSSIRVSTVTPGQLPPAPAVAYAGASPLGILDSASGGARVLVVATDPDRNYSLQILDFPAPDAAASLEVSQSYSTMGAAWAGASVAADGTRFALNTDTETVTPSAPKLFFEPADAASLAQSGCGASDLTALSDIADHGDGQVIALTQGTSSAPGAALYTFDGTDGGTCTALPTFGASTSTSFVPDGNGHLGVEDGGYTLTLNGVTADQSNAVALARVSSAGVLDETVGQDGYTYVNLHALGQTGGLNTGPSALSGNVLYLPLRTATGPALLRFVRNP